MVFILNMGFNEYSGKVIWMNQIIGKYKKCRIYFVDVDFIEIDNVVNNEFVLLIIIFDVQF